MKLISHRGNISGKQPSLENTPDYIDNALELGYDVEIDVWWHNESFYLGHDEPTYKIETKYLQDHRLWCHAKNGESLYQMRQYKDIHCFWHQEDDFTLTSEGFIWTFPKKSLYCNSICVLPEHGYKGDLTKCYGICSDNIIDYKDII
jgi:hypothetical protein